MKIGSVVKVRSKDSLEEQEFYESIDNDEFEERMMNEVIKSKGLIIKEFLDDENYPFMVEFEITMPIRFTFYFSAEELEEQ